jgi:hypothetical protein
MRWFLWLTAPGDPWPRTLDWPRTLLLVLVLSAINCVGVVFGAWYLPFVSGIFAGQLLAPARRAIAAGALAGLVAWGLPLAWEHWRYGIGPTAESLAAIMGFGHAGSVPVILTCLIGLLLGLCGAWTMTALRTAARARR